MTGRAGQKARLPAALAPWVSRNVQRAGALAERVASWPGRIALPMALLAGLVANLGFAPFNAWPAYWVALTLLVWLMDGAARASRPFRAAFARAGLFGIGFYGIGMHWIANAFLVDAEAFGHMVWLVGLLIVSFAAFWAVTFGLLIRWWCPGPRRLPIFVMALLASEYIRGHMPFGGFPWNIPGMVWAPGGAVSQTASIIGVWGLSALTVSLFAAPACLVAGAEVPGRARMPSARARSLAALACPCLLTILWAGGAWRLAAAPSPDAAAPVVRIIDAGVPQKEKYLPGNGEKILQRYLELTGPDSGAGEEGPGIVVWPEVATPFLLLQSPNAIDRVAETLGGRLLIVGTARNEKGDGGGLAWFNSLAVIDGESGVRGPLAVYDKHRLVPFGEYIPLPQIASRLNIASIQYLTANGFRRGPPPDVLEIGGYPPFVPLICYEAIFEGLVPRGGPRADWMVNISIDTWFGELLGPEQHYAHARYRAIEEGLPLARAASGGYSGMIDAFGRVTVGGGDADSSGSVPEAWKATTLDAILPKALKTTGFAAGGSRVFGFLFAMISLWLFVSLRR